MIFKGHAVGNRVDSICIVKSPFRPKELMPPDAGGCQPMPVLKAKPLPEITLYWGKLPQTRSSFLSPDIPILSLVSVGI